MCICYRLFIFQKWISLSNFPRRRRHLTNTFTWRHHLNNRGALGHNTSLPPHFFLYNACSKPGEWVVMYMCTRGSLILLLWFSVWIRDPVLPTNDHGYVPLVENTSRYFPHSWLITGFVTELTRRVPLVEQELLTLPKHRSSPPVFGRVRVSRSLVLCVCLVDLRLSFCTFYFGHCVVCSSAMHGFWLPLWYPQTLLQIKIYLPFILVYIL
jgi:hypothetical protein